LSTGAEGNEDLTDFFLEINASPTIPLMAVFDFLGALKF
jgi:hypothetical protein